MDSDEEEFDDRFGTCDFEMPAPGLPSTADIASMVALSSTTSMIDYPLDPALSAQQQAFLDQIIKMGLITENVIERAQKTDLDSAISEAIESDAQIETERGAMGSSDDVIDESATNSSELPVNQDAVTELLSRFQAIQDLGPQWGAGSSLNIQF
jgi:hypothetical protein